MESNLKLEASGIDLEYMGPQGTPVRTPWTPFFPENGFNMFQFQDLEEVLSCDVSFSLGPLMVFLPTLFKTAMRLMNL